ncbi:hypothetical protein [Jatrophihabitans fulvus]
MSIDQHDDLEAQLRTMLRERARDITTVPERVFAFEQEDGLAGPRRSWRPGPRLTAVAAAVVAVLAVAGTVLAVRGGGDDGEPPAISSAPSPSVTIVPQEQVVLRAAALSWVGPASLPAYTVDWRTSWPGFRQIGLYRTVDGPRRLNGVDTYRTLVTVYDPAAFDAATVAGWRTGSVDGTSVRFGTARIPGDDSRETARTLAFRAASGRWVLVQGLTPDAEPDAALAAVARLVRPDSTVVQRVPFRLSSAPGRLRTELMTLGGKSADALHIRLGSRIVGLELDVSDSVPTGGAGYVRRQVDGRTAWVDYELMTANVQVADGVAVTVSLSTFNGYEPSRTALRAQFDRILDGITWATGRNRPTAEQAIP